MNFSGVLISIPKKMQDILNLINTMSETGLGIKDSIIQNIDSFDASDMSIVDLRGYIQYIKGEMRRETKKDAVDCYFRLMNKLHIELRCRPFNEQFPGISADIDKIKEGAAELLESIKYHSVQINNFHNINSKRDQELDDILTSKLEIILKTV